MLIAIVSATSTALAPSPLNAGTSDLQFQANTYTTGNQWFGDVARGSDGRFVMTWASDGSSGSDSSQTSVQVRRWSASGLPEGDELQVNTYTTNQQFAPAVAIDGLGRFVVVWASLGSSGTDTSTWSIQGQRFSATGALEGPQFQVNSHTSGFQEIAEVSMGPGGEFVVTWQSSGSTGNDTAGYSVQARRFTDTGTPAGPDFQVNTYTFGDQGYPSVASGSDGRFILAWESSLSDGTDTSDSSVHARVFDSNGNPVTGQFQVNIVTSYDQGRPAVGVDPTGNFIVAWQSYASSGTDTSGRSIQARRYSPIGTPIGSEFQVNTYTNYDQISPAIAADGTGGFVITWLSEDSNSIRARRYRPDGTPDGADFQVNTYTFGFPARPSISSTPEGDFVIAFDSLGSGGDDDSSRSMQIRRFDALFRDGFESGNTDQWSDVVP